MAEEKNGMIEEQINITPISVDAMVDENRSAIITSDYQRYIRKEMKKAAGKL